MRRFNLRGTDTLSALRPIFASRLASDTAIAEETVRDILADVRLRGDESVLELTRRFDFADAQTIRVPEAAIDFAVAQTQQTDLWAAMNLAAGRIRDFHRLQVRSSWFDNSRPGEILGQLIRPLDRVGIYIPGGAAAYPSTVLMTAVPAAVAGVGAVVLATPPSKETGLPPAATLAAARLAGVDEVYAMGGAQAIGALAYGTDTILPVDKIVGPGNIYANIAQRMVFGTVGIGLLAGPSEVAILFDETADPGAIATDLICQTEHTPNNAALLVAPHESLIEAVLAAVQRQLANLPRAAVVRQSLAEFGFAVVVRDLPEGAEVVNAFAAEHLHIVTRDPWSILGAIRHAGAILIGPHSAAALGDYVAGPSHTLPTAGGARFFSPLHVDDFVKKSSLIALDQAAAMALGPTAAVIGRFEGLEGHVRSALSAAARGDRDQER